MDAHEDYPRSWRKMEHRSGIAIKDASGVTVLFVPFTGKATADAKRRTALLILEAVNQHVGEAAPTASPAGLTLPRH